MVGAPVVSERRLEQFAHERGMLFDREPPVRRSPSVFRRYDDQRPVGWLGVPGATGFEVGQRIESVALHTADNAAQTSRLTWAAFTLRADVAAGVQAPDVVTAIMPHGWHVESGPDELVVWTRRRIRLTSASLWSLLTRVQVTLELQLARPASVSDLAERHRRGVRRAIER